MDINSARELIAELGEELYRRFLTDSTGGNLSIRIGDQVVMTPPLRQRALALASRA